MANKITEIKSDLIAIKNKKSKVTTPTKEPKVELKKVLKVEKIVQKKSEDGKTLKNINMKKSIRKPLKGLVMSTKMKNTVVVAIERRVAHKLYGKLIKVTRRLKADTNGIEVKEGDVVTIEQTRPISKDKNFKVIKKEASRV